MAQTGRWVLSLVRHWGAEALIRLLSSLLGIKTSLGLIHYQVQASVGFRLQSYTFTQPTDILQTQAWIDGRADQEKEGVLRTGLLNLM
jgi:hypothetical protein